MSKRAKITAQKSRAKEDNTVSLAWEHKRLKTIDPPTDKILHLQSNVGNQGVQRLFELGILQAKLKIAKPGDKYEKEADRIADIVMKMPEPVFPVLREKEGIGWQPEEEEEEPVQTKPADGAVLQRQEEEKEEEPIQTKSIGTSSAKVTPNIESSINSLKGRGHSLSKEVRNYFEPRFGHDFSKVRIHTNVQAAETAKSINAKAFTTGEDVVFGTGEYSPETDAGKRLLAHELTHVLQQKGSSVAQTFRIQRKEKKIVWVKDRKGSLYYKTQEEANRRRRELEKKGEWTEYRVVPFKQKKVTYWRVEMWGLKKTSTSLDPLWDIINRIIKALLRLIKKIINIISKLIQEQAKKLLRILETIKKAADIIDKIVLRLLKSLPLKYRTYLEKLWAKLKRMLKRLYDRLKKYLEKLAKRKKKKSISVKFTFDDGPRSSTDAILSTLATHSIKAGFFITGPANGSQMGKVKNIIAGKHVVGNHTWDHSHNPKMFEKLHNYILKNNKYRMTYWRGPGGSQAGLAKISKTLGYNPHTHWEFDSLDYKKLSAKQIVANRILKGSRGAGPKGVLLMHDIHAAKILPALIKELTANSIKIKNFP